MSFVGKLLRDPAAALLACRDETEQRQIALTALLLIILGGLSFGAAVGSFRGFPQLGIAALKLPVVTLLTLAVAGPAFFGISTAVGRHFELRETLAIVLSAGARSSLVLIAVAPLLALAVDVGAPYELVRFAAVGGYGLAGISALLFILRALGNAPGRALGALCFVGVFALFGAQTAWLLRPYLGDPRDATVPTFAHGRTEGGVYGALFERGRR